MSWTPERVKQLKRELQQGKKTAEIVDFRQFALYITRIFP